MKKKIMLVITCLTLALTMIFGLLPACGGGEPQPTGTGAPTSTGIVSQGEKYQWRWQSNANAGTQTYWLSEEFAQVVKDASAGRIILDLQPQGAIVGTLEIFDAVATGAIEAGSSCD
jgi:TRAP-type mannitol/chloroaromatic compound transport system substrate-binding protein